MTKEEYETAVKEKATAIDIEILDARCLVVANGSNLTDLVEDHKVISTGENLEVWLKLKAGSIYTALSATTEAQT